MRMLGVWRSARRCVALMYLAARPSELCAVSRRCTSGPATECLREGRQIAKAHAVGDSVQLECRIGEQRLDEFPEDRFPDRTERRPFGFQPALHAALAHRQASRHDATFGTHTRCQERAGRLRHPLLERCEPGDLGRKRRRQLRQLLGDPTIAKPRGACQLADRKHQAIVRCRESHRGPNARDASSAPETRTCRKSTSRTSRSGYARRSMRMIAIDKYSTACGLLSKVRSQGWMTTLAVSRPMSRSILIRSTAVTATRARDCRPSARWPCDMSR